MRRTAIQEPAREVVASGQPFLGADIGEADFRALCAVLRERRDFDPGMYKDGCIRRRIAGRVRARGCREVSAYLELLSGDEGEVDALMAALTVHVSQFFRNPSMFAVLREQALPGLLQRLHRRDRRELNVWSVGCAGGEEPYSVALLLDQLLSPRMGCSIRGTDVSAGIVARAREGVFEAHRLAKLPAELQEKYFDPEGLRYRLQGRIREMVTFDTQNILGPEPYPAADLILCRNVLIYFSRQEQERVLARIADSLSEGGLLILGRAESLVGAGREKFAVLDSAERIFIRHKH